MESGDDETACFKNIVPAPGSRNFILFVRSSKQVGALAFCTTEALISSKFYPLPWVATRCRIMDLFGLLFWTGFCPSKQNPEKNARQAADAVGEDAS